MIAVSRAAIQSGACRVFGREAGVPISDSTCFVVMNRGSCFSAFGSRTSRKTFFSTKSRRRRKAWNARMAESLNRTLARAMSFFIMSSVHSR
jgi:hypothetical protein